MLPGEGRAISAAQSSIILCFLGLICNQYIIVVVITLTCIIKSVVTGQFFRPAVDATC